MKYSDGFWLNQPGYNVSYATQMYEVTAGENALHVYATAQRIENRGMTLGGPVLEITFTSTLPDTIKVSIDHFKGIIKKGPDFELYEDKTFRPVINKLENGGYELVSNKTKVVLGAQGGAWSVEYYYEDKLLTKSGWRTTSLIEEEQWVTDRRMAADKGQRFYARSQSSDSSTIREMLSIAVGEKIYGFGEKFSTFVKNGQTVEIWNNDGGTCSEQSYKSIPFYVTTNNYGVFVNNPGKVTFEVASETVSKVSFAVQGQHMEYFLIDGGSVANVIESYTTLTGKPALPPAYSFGLWLTTSFTTNYDEETVTYFIDKMAKYDIPLQVFHFDCFWMRDFEWCSFKWDERMFPDAKAMLARLKAKGIQICVWINPYISQKSYLFDEGMKNGYFIKNPDGSVFQCDMWQPGLAIVDFTNPEASKWYASKLRALCEMGVDCFKTDFGERIPTVVTYFDGSDPIRMHNYYTYLYNECVFNVLKEYYGENKACLFARSATVGGQKFPVHWGGDCFSNYESMWETLRGGLSLCMSGFGFFSHDISGFEATGTPDLYKRWTAFGLLSTHSRYHGNSSYRVPWNFDEEACKVSSHFTKLKGRLMPYLFSNAVYTHQTGVPMMRSMVIDFAYDKSTHTVDTQYMLGDSLLVAPVFNEEGIADFYLPTGGEWTDIQTGEKLTGGSWYQRKYDYFGLPLYAKPCSIIPMGDFVRDFEYDYLTNATFRIFGLRDGYEASRKLYDKDAKEIFEILAGRECDEIKLSFTKTDSSFKVQVDDRVYEIPAGCDSYTIRL